MNRKRTILKNAGANVLSGGAAAILAVALPPFLVRLLPPPVFAAWALILDVAAYSNLLRFGIQTAVGKYVAESYELDEPDMRNRVINTSVAMLGALAVPAFFLVLLIYWQFGHLFHQVPSAIQADARFALLLIGGTIIIGFPASVFNGIFIGVQKFEFPALISGSSKLLIGLVLVLIAAAPHVTLVELAEGWASVTLLGYGAQIGACLRVVPAIRFSVHWMQLETARQIAGYSLSLTVWSVAMLMVVGLDTAIVGAFDFGSVGFYAIAAGLVTLIAGLQNSAFSAFIPVESAINASGAGDIRLGDMLVTTTRYSSLLLLATGLPLLLFTTPILGIWLGGNYIIQTRPLVQILVVANMIRLTATPYAVMLISTGQHRRVIISPLLEGAVNLGFSTWLGYRMGAIGVALGTLVGACVGLSAHVLYNMPRTTFSSSRRREWMVEGLARPLACALPALLGLMIVGRMPGVSKPFGVSGAIAVLGLTGGCFWFFGLLPGERRACFSLLVAPRHASASR